MSQTFTERELTPENPLLRDATVEALTPRVEPQEIQKFLELAASVSTPAPLGATGSVNIAIWGTVDCKPQGQPWKYNTEIWGGPAYFGSAVGVMYTAYDTWDAFFRNVTSVHAQGIAEGGGILQINWMNSSGVPCGQFNGAAGGVGLLEAGGSGGWQRA
ncbi:hypothetical protein UG55_1007147 [Frankia sp. EI5c]|uniref:hypothetical protein n=1 Tax=Frankia sp. EI5c TaxID=683316 RepID=UPI0007C2FD8F|nr:hypothetical protein [Frankia sp. EI5c]OAA27819.1 hypothetical protein UG55_1007147 [Frankia sp. EI5c]